MVSATVVLLLISLILLIIALVSELVLNFMKMRNV